MRGRVRFSPDFLTFQAKFIFSQVSIQMGRDYIRFWPAGIWIDNAWLQRVTTQGIINMRPVVPDPQS